MRTVPAGITALQGQSTSFAPLWLVKLELASGTRYFSSGAAVSWNGQTWEANRVTSIGSLDVGLIDRKTNNLPKIEITFDNLADNGSSAFPFTSIDASESFQDRKLTVYCYSPDASDAILVAWGYCTSVSFSSSPSSYTATVSATHFWATYDLDVPAKYLSQMGFGPTDGTAKLNEDGEEEEEFVVQQIYCAGTPKVRPLIYNKWTDGAYFHINAILSGTHASQPFDIADINAADTKLFNNTPATEIDFKIGNQVAADGNLTRFPSGAAHTNVAHFYAAFPITNEIKDKTLDDIKSHLIKMNLVAGKRLKDAGLASENPALILKDILRDEIYGTGLPSALFDSITTTANYVGTRYQCRYELKKSSSLTQRVQSILGDFHGFITFEGGLIQIGCKKNTESSVATFATSDGGSGRKIHEDVVSVVNEKDASELINKVIRKFRVKKRQRRIFIMQDSVAQTRAGGSQPKPVKEEYDQWEEGGPYDEEQNKILGAITVREEQSGNLFIQFSSPIWDAIDVAIGDVITVLSPNIPNNGSNYLFRVTKQSIDTGEPYLISFNCQVYKPAIYNDDYAGLGVDLLRGGNDTSAIGRPPDVTPVSLAVVDVVTDDVEGKQATVRATFTVPAHDATTEQSEGLFREPPISEVEIWWQYTDMEINEVWFGGTKELFQSTSAFNESIEFQVDYKKTKSIRAWFVALGPNRASSRFGYIPDPTKETSLTANLTATAITASVGATAAFAVNDYVQIGREFLKVLSKTGTSLTFVNDGTNRTPQFGSISIAHPLGTEIAVAKLSYPTQTLALGRRFTYPIVTGLVGIITPDGVRFRWDDPDADNIETFFLYWSVLATALTDPDLLGSATPAWYLMDPYAPPAGVNLSLNDDRAHKVTQSEIGGSGITVYGRVAASNRRNFSSALSSSASASSTGTGVAPTANPSSPDAALLLENTIHYTAEEVSARVKAKIWANDLDHSQTFQQVGALFAFAVFRRNSDTSTEPIKLGGAISDLTATFIEVEGLLPFGESYDWRSNILSNGTGKTTSTGSAYTFTTGGVLKVKPGDATTVPAPTFGTITRNESNNKEDLVPITLTQNGSVIILFTSLWIEKSIAGGAWNFETSIDLNHVLDLYTGVSATKTFNVTIKRKAAVAAQYRVLARARGGKESAWTTSATQGATDVDGAFTPGALAFPGSLLTNTVDGDPEQNLARIAITFTTADSLSFDSNHITGIDVRFIERNEANTADVGEPFRIQANVSGGASSANRQYYLKIGRRYRITQVLALNGDKFTLTTGTLDFIAGGVISVDPAESKTVPAPTFFAQPAADGNKLVSFTVRVAQDGVDIVWMKELIVEVSYGGGAYKLIEGGPIGLKAADTLYASVSASKDFAFSVKRKAGVTLDVRASVKAVRGKLSAVTNATQLAASIGDLSEDSAAAGAVQSLSLVWSSKKGWKGTWQRPTTGTNSLKGYNVVFHDNAASNFMNPVTGALSSPNSEAGATVFVTDTSYATLLKYANLAAQFTSGVKIKVTPINVVGGVETLGTATTSSLVAPVSDDPAAGDAAVPSSLATPTIVWDESRGGLLVKGMGASVNGNILVAAKILIHDNAGTYFDFTTQAGTASEGTAMITTGDIRRHFIPCRLKKLRAVLGNTIYCYYYLENQIGTSVSPSSNGSVSVASSSDFLSSNNAVAVLDVTALMSNSTQLAWNGDFTQDDGTTSTTLGSWVRTSSTSWATSNVITTTTTDPVYWEQSNHRIVWRGKTNWINLDLGKTFIPGNYYCISFWIKSDGTITPTLHIHFRDNSGANLTADPSDAVTTITVSPDLTTSYQVLTAKLRIKSTGGSSAKVWLSFECDTNLLGDGGSRLLYIDRVMVNEGPEPARYARRPRYEQTAGSENFSISPSSVGTPPDAVIISGTQGGGLNTIGARKIDFNELII